MHNPVNSVISFVLLIVLVVGSFYYVYALTPGGPWMGITGGGFLDPEVAEVLGLDQDRGFLVFSIASGSPADRAGVQGGGANTVDIGGRMIPIDGDIIVSMDGRQLSEAGDVCAVLAGKEVGDNVMIGVNRDGNLHEFNLVLEASPPGQSSEC